MISQEEINDYSENRTRNCMEQKAQCQGLGLESSRVIGMSEGLKPSAALHNCIILKADIENLTSGL